MVNHYIWQPPQKKMTGMENPDITVNCCSICFLIFLAGLHVLWILWCPSRIRRVAPKTPDTKGKSRLHNEEVKSPISRPCQRSNLDSVEEMPYPYNPFPPLAEFSGSNHSRTHCGVEYSQKGIRLTMINGLKKGKHMSTCTCCVPKNNQRIMPPKQIEKYLKTNIFAKQRLPYRPPRTALPNSWDLPCQESTAWRGVARKGHPAMTSWYVFWRPFHMFHAQELAESRHPRHKMSLCFDPRRSQLSRCHVLFSHSMREQ